MSSEPKIDPAKISQLREFIRLCQAKPEILHLPEMGFFKLFIESYGGTIPPSTTGTKEPPQPETMETEPTPPPQPTRTEPKQPEPEPEEEVESEESDLDIDDEGVIPPDTDPPQQMGDTTKEVTCVKYNQ
jgi:suppressor of tumorigenicity protein 13